MEIINMGGQISSADFGQFSVGVYNTMAHVLCSKLFLCQISLFEMIREFRQLKEMQNTEYNDISTKYAPIKYIISKILASDSNCRHLVVADLKKH